MNLMSENGINLYNTVSVLGYCLLPMDILSLLSLVLNTTYVNIKMKDLYIFYINLSY